MKVEIVQLRAMRTEKGPIIFMIDPFIISVLDDLSLGNQAMVFR